MVIKTFNVDEETYSKFSEYCKSSGISMSKLVDLYIKTMIEEDVEKRKKYLLMLFRFRKNKFLSLEDFEKELLK